MPIIGTAGHIDHGKTALIKALTGIDTDRLEEEKARGISIDLGFAHFDLGNGERVGVIDVPGHERFLKNMLAGAHGIDLVLLVVAADDGVMPQTEEHLDIVHLLGSRRGVIAITKTDLVDSARVAEVEEEIEILVCGTILEGAPVVRVSALAHEGIEQLRAALEQQLSALPSPSLDGYFRLPVDRAFAVHGHGKVVTGTAVAGSVRVGDLLRVLPGGDEVRVRNVHVHNHDTLAAHAGQRIALNLLGADHLERGQVVCDRRLERTTERFDAWLEVRPGGGTLKAHQGVRVYAGSAEAIGKIIPLARDRFEPRQQGYAQLTLRTPLHLMRGDRFVVRNETAQRTIGGGVVIDVFARRHRRSEGQLAQHLQQLHHASTPVEILTALVARDQQLAVELGELAQASGLLPEQLRSAARSSDELMLLPDRDNPTACLAAERWTAVRASVLAEVAAFHGRQPSAPGIEMESLRSALLSTLAPKLFRILIEALVAEGTLARAESVLRLPTHRVSVDDKIGAQLEVRLEAGGFTPPDVRELAAEMATQADKLLRVLHELERQGRVARIDATLYFAAKPLGEIRERARAFINEHGSISAAQLRDLLGASRKFSIALLDYFDRTGFTLRVGDLRKLRR